MNKYPEHELQVRLDDLSIIESTASLAESSDDETSSEHSGSQTDGRASGTGSLEGSSEDGGSSSDGDSSDSSEDDGGKFTSSLASSSDNANGIGDAVSLAIKVLSKRIARKIINSYTAHDDDDNGDRNGPSQTSAGNNM